MRQYIKDVDGLIAALCDCWFETYHDPNERYDAASHARIRALVPQFVVTEEEPLTVARIVTGDIPYFVIAGCLKDWLDEHEYDGLFRADGCDTCGCSLDDFAPCDDGPLPDCRPAFRRKDGMMYLEPEEEKTCE